ncbi:DUF4262 domain-containing protein [Modestobacter sp. SSW1-42]|uniref:DUF4262 domain-containing protein n=1 Tax=Modestobacter sp. SSW1-42 TaxID=596372 RepID=UPI0039862FE0
MRFRRKPKPAPATPAPAGTPGTDAAQDQTAEQVRRDLQRVIDRFGWAVLHGGGNPGDPRYSTTVGLTALGHPEVIVLGLPFEAGEKYLNLVGEAVRGGARFSPGVATTALTDASSPVVFLAVDGDPRTSVAEQFHGSIEVLQLVWPDSTGKLPWEEGHRNPPHAQPLLGPPPVG